MIDYVTLVLGECQVICPGARRGQQSPDSQIETETRGDNLQPVRNQEQESPLSYRLH